MFSLVIPSLLLLGGLARSSEANAIETSDTALSLPSVSFLDFSRHPKVRSFITTRLSGMKMRIKEEVDQIRKEIEKTALIQAKKQLRSAEDIQAMKQARDTRKIQAKKQLRDTRCYRHTFCQLRYAMKIQAKKLRDAGKIQAKKKQVEDASDIQAMKQAQDAGDAARKDIKGKGKELYKSCRKVLALIIYKNFLGPDEDQKKKIEDHTAGHAQSKDEITKTCRIACKRAARAIDSGKNLHINLTETSFSGIPVQALNDVFNFFPSFISLDLSRSEGLMEVLFAGLALRHVKKIKICSAKLEEMPILYLCQALEHIDLRNNGIRTVCGRKYNLYEIRMRNKRFYESIQNRLLVRASRGKLSPPCELFADYMSIKDRPELKGIACGKISVQKDYVTMPNVKEIDLRMNPVCTWRLNMLKIMINPTLTVHLSRICVRFDNTDSDDPDFLCTSCGGFRWFSKATQMATCNGSCGCGRANIKKVCEDKRCYGCECSFSVGVKPRTATAYNWFRYLAIFQEEKVDI